MMNYALNNYDNLIVIREGRFSETLKNVINERTITVMLSVESFTPIERVG